MGNTSVDVIALETGLLQRAAQDAAFRQMLLATPREAIEQALGVALPPSMEIQVVEETPNKICLVLPMQPRNSELSEDELSAVAGGLELSVPRADTRQYTMTGVQRLVSLRASLPLPIP